MNWKLKQDKFHIQSIKLTADGTGWRKGSRKILVELVWHWVILTLILKGKEENNVVLTCSTVPELHPCRGSATEEGFEASA